MGVRPRRSPSTSPIEDSSGFVIFDLPLFKNGLSFLSPNGEVSLYWDDLDSLLPYYLRENGLEEGFWVRTSFKDLAGYSYETEWHLNPFLYEHGRYITHRSLGDLVDVIEHALQKLTGDYQQPETTKRKGQPSKAMGRTGHDIRTDEQLKGVR